MARRGGKRICSKSAGTATSGLLAVLIFLAQTGLPVRAQDNIPPTVLTMIESAAAHADASMMSAVVIDGISSHPSSVEAIVQAAAHVAPAYSLKVSLDALDAFPGFSEQITRAAASVTQEIAGTVNAIAKQPTPLLGANVFLPPSPGEVGFEQRRKEGGLSDFDISLAVGPGLEPTYEGDDAYDAVLVPDIHITWRDRLFLDWTGSSGEHLRRGFGAKLLRSRTFTAGPYLTYDPGREESVSPNLLGMGDVDSVFEAGIFAEWHSGSYQFSVDYKQSLLEEGHDGSLLTLAGGYGERITDQLGVGFTGWATYASENYMTSYYSVNAQQAAATSLTRPIFNPGSGFKDIAGNITLRFDWNENWHSLFAGQWKRLVGDAAASPLSVTDAENQLFLGTTIGYKF